MSSNEKKEEFVLEEPVAVQAEKINNLSLNEKKKKLVILQSSDKEEFEVEECVAIQSNMIRNIIEDCDLIKSIPLQNVNGETLGKIIEYCTKHADDENEEDVEKFDEEFLNVHQSVLYDLIMAANYLVIKDLLDKLCKKVASMIKGKTVEEIRETFKIQNDFTAEREKQIRKENLWAFQ